ncbi:hypothetical protein EVAR_50545_1 [Eumeta japonica]|uniref:Uncharacterized protein n=1 Tax=Eumeta variegata TaxID=151549 RepID=A0A4C1YNC7_EUMVA|nr:hypothetical protein EVAR_50545_1 [Eumeta japonica]
MLLEDMIMTNELLIKLISLAHFAYHTARLAVVATTSPRDGDDRSPPSAWRTGRSKGSCIIALWRAPRVREPAAGSGEKLHNSADREFYFHNEMTQL